MHAYRTRWLWLVLSCCWLCPTGCGPALPHHEGSQEPFAIPFGIADPTEKATYVMSQDGGIEAIALTSGRLLWSTSAASVPLAIHEKALVAQAAVEGKPNQVKIVVLDPRQEGKVLLTSDAVTFPESVNVGLAYGRSFSSQGRVIQGKLFLHWSAKDWAGTGYEVKNLGEEKSRKEASGVAKVNLGDGGVEMVSEDDAGLEPAPKVPEELEKLKDVEKLRGAVSYTPSDKPLIVGKRAVVFAVKIENAGPKMVLMQWDLETGKELDDIDMLRPNIPLGTGKEFPHIELLDGNWTPGPFSLDGRNVFIRHQETKADWRKSTAKGGLSANEVPIGRQQWWIFSMESGALLGKVPLQDGSVEAVERVRDRVYFGLQDSTGVKKPEYQEFPRTLRVIDSNSGTVLWERAVFPAKRLHPKS
jgi:hypothetical protein